MHHLTSLYPFTRAASRSPHSVLTHAARNGTPRIVATEITIGIVSEIGLFSFSSSAAQLKRSFKEMEAVGHILKKTYAPKKTAPTVFQASQPPSTMTAIKR